MWLLRTRGIRMRAKEAGQTFDEFEEGVEWQSRGFDLEKKLLSRFSKKTPKGESSHVDMIGREEDVEAESNTPKTVPNATR